MSKNDYYSSANPIVAYAVVHDEETVFTGIDGKPVAAQVSSHWRHLPEARNLRWTDDYFEDEPNSDIVAVFDLDYDAMESYYQKMGWSCYGASLCCTNIFWLATFCMVPCYMNQNVSWNVRAQHVAITRDGIRFVHDRRQTCWGKPWSDAGKNTKTIPFDQITDCSITEPAGNTCLWIPNTLFLVNVDTASSKEKGHELTLTGLKDPFAFKNLVWAMKRQNGQQQPIDRTMDSLSSVMERCHDTCQNRNGSHNNTQDVAVILRDIRDELRAIRTSSAAVASSPTTTETIPAATAVRVPATVASAPVEPKK